jgi:hypothetical protein
MVTKRRMLKTSPFVEALFWWAVKDLNLGPID